MIKKKKINEGLNLEQSGVLEKRKEKREKEETRKEI